MDQSNIDACPFESTKRSRLGQMGSCGSKRITRFHKVYTRGASAIGVPGCPDLACWTASIERVRIVLMANWAALTSVVALAAVTELMNTSSVFRDPLTVQSTDALLLPFGIEPVELKHSGRKRERAGVKLAETLTLTHSMLASCTELPLAVKPLLPSAADAARLDCTRPQETFGRGPKRQTV